MKIILFRSNNIFDSRVNKYHNYYKRVGLNYTIVGWDRKGESLQRENYDFFRYEAGVAVGGLKALRNHAKWMMFVYSYLKKHPDVTTIHACDLNSAFPAALYKKNINPKVNLIFDACDWFSANFADKWLLRRSFEHMEKFTCKWADELIICEPERKAQLSFPLSKEPQVMPNIPEIDENELKGDDERYHFENNWPTLSYFGGFTNDRFLIELIEAAKTEKINLLIGGTGNKIVEDKLQEVANASNIRWFGRMDMKDGLIMSSKADAIYAMYCKTNPNHIYAAPNKYYEAMLLGKPLITTKGTILEEKVNKNITGYVIEEDMEELLLLLKSLNREDMQKRGENARHLWNNKYMNYISDFFETTYSSIIR